MATFCSECRKKGKTVLAFGKGFCKMHQNKRPDFDKRSISQRALDKEKSNPNPIRENKISKGTFVMPDEELNSKIEFAPVPEAGYDGELTSYLTMDEIGVWGTYSGVKGSAESKRWFEARHIELKGYCSHCGQKSSKGDPKYWKFSIAHLLAAALFPSVACHPQNFLELCFWSPSCHTNFDSGMLPITQLNCFDEAITKIAAMYPHLTAQEKGRLSPIILEYIKIDL